MIPDRWTPQGNAAAWLAEIRAMASAGPTQTSPELPRGLVLNVAGTLVGHPETLEELRRPITTAAPTEVT